MLVTNAPALMKPFEVLQDYYTRLLNVKANVVARESSEVTKMRNNRTSTFIAMSLRCSGRAMTSFSTGGRQLCHYSNPR